ncbi:G-protein coupled receptor Mth2-like isoform X2 [Epargyreus clarus]|uniref:G-protein coupled receptor Mth2-like isoform X2 n=1 Tax=Epargyreus clarus TaxID=520877 RepID=UPI003C3091AF
MFASLFMVLFFSCINGQPCEDIASIELKGDLLSDGSILHDGINFPPKYVYSKNISGEIKTFGCVCEIRSCLRKCCEIGYAFYNRTCTKLPNFDKIGNNGVKLHYRTEYSRTVGLQSADYFVMYGRPSPFMYREANWYVQEDGNLYIEVPTKVLPWMTVGPDMYCIDSFVTDNADGTKTSEIDALVCFPQDEDTSDYLLSSSCMLVSCVFILATVGVYVWLPQLHNIHGRVLIAYLLCLFVGFIFLACMQLLLLSEQMSKTSCLVMTFIIYYALLSAFFWLNVMCFDIWRVFSGKREMRLEKIFVRSKLRAYALYAFGIPTLLTIVLAALHFSSLPDRPWMPMLLVTGCFISGTSKLIYLYGPIVILCVANMTLFVLTALKIAKTKQETSVLNSRDSSRHDQQNGDMQRIPRDLNRARHGASFSKLLLRIFGVVETAGSGSHPNSYW